MTNLYVMQHTLQQFAVETFNNVLKYKGIKQTELADKLNYNRQRVWGYLTGKSEFTLQTFEAFCTALDIPAAKIFENFDKLEVPERIVDEIKGMYPGKKDGLIEALKEENKVHINTVAFLDRQNKRLLSEIDRLEKQLSEADVELEKLKNQNK